MEILKKSDRQDERSKSSLRMRYLAEVEVLKRELGELEEARAKLGLSRRKVCQLLLVDPSAWTRWSRKPETCPPHIWKMLHLLLKDGGKLGENLHLESEIEKLKTEMDQKIQEASRSIHRRSLALGGLLLVLFLIFVYFIA